MTNKNNNKDPIVSLTSLNPGIQKGKPMVLKFRGQISGNIFFVDDKNFKSPDNHIICFQEMDRNFQFMHNYGNILNKTKSNNPKSQQLRIVYDNNRLKVINEIETNYRLQIVEFQLDGVYNFVVVNSHIPQKGKTGDIENMTVFKKLMKGFRKEGITVFSPGDFNRSFNDVVRVMDEKSKNWIKSVHEKEYTTTGNRSIDNIYYSPDVHLKSFNIFKDFTTSSNEAEINHYTIRSSFEFLKTKSIKEGLVQTIYDKINSKMEKIKKEQENKEQVEQPEQKEQPTNSKKKTNLKTSDIDGISNELLIEKVKDRFINENGKWDLNKFFERYFKGFCCKTTLKNFFEGKTKKSKCKPKLIEYIQMKLELDVGHKILFRV